MSDDPRAPRWRPPTESNNDPTPDEAGSASPMPARHRAGGRASHFRTGLLGIGIIGLVLVVSGLSGWLPWFAANAQPAALATHSGPEIDEPTQDLTTEVQSENTAVVEPVSKAPERVSTPTVHVVSAGESLLEIADNYGVKAELIARANDLWDPNRLQIGQVLTIPVSGSQVMPVQAPQTGQPRMWWPLQGEITTEFGEREAYYIGGAHTGLDMAAQEGDPVRSAVDGRVVSTIKQSDNLGWHIVIDAGGGWTTIYGHLSRFFVEGGDKVERGDLIGAAGDTGFSFGPHLHFEVQHWGTPVDPQKYLPK